MFALAVTGVMFFATSTLAATDEQDLSVGVKTLPLLSNKITGTVKLAIVFDPVNPASRAEANGIKAILDGGFEAPGDLKLVGVMLPVADLGMLSGNKIAVLTSGLSGHYDTIRDAASSNGVLTMSTDLECVRANRCVLGIVSKPHVEIYFSKMAADAAKLGFEQAFTMLVKQI